MADGEHARQQIRDAVAALLTGLPCCDDRVYIGRARPLPADKTTGFQPFSLRIYTAQDSGSNMTLSFPSTQMRRLVLRIEGTVITDEAPDDLLDAAAVQVEKKIASDLTLGGQVKLQSLSAPTTTIMVEAKGDKQDGGFRIEYVMSYSVKQNAPDVIV